MTIAEMRKTLILWTIREYKCHYSEHKVYLDIIRWQRMSDDKVKRWYNKYFKTEDK